MIKTLKFVFFIGFSLGTLLTVGAGYSLIKQAIFAANAIVTQGRITEMVKMRSVDSEDGYVHYYYLPKVEFNDQHNEPRTFTSSDSGKQYGYQVGYGVSVIYSPQNPDDAEVNNFFALWGIRLIFFAAGSFLMFMSMLFLAALYAETLLHRYLKKHGIAVKTEFEDIKVNHEAYSDGTPCYQICSQWQNPKNAKTYHFSSAYLRKDPRAYVPNQPITVYLSRKNPNRYSMDVSFVPKALFL